MPRHGPHRQPRREIGRTAHCGPAGGVVRMAAPTRSCEEPSMSKRAALAVVVAFCAGWVAAELRYAASGRGDTPSPEAFVSESQFAEALVPSVTLDRPLYFYRESAYPQNSALYIADHPL